MQKNFVQCTYQIAVCSIVGGVSSKQVRSTSSVEDSASVIKEARETSKIDPTEFIERQQQLLDEIKDSKPSDRNDEIVVMRDDEITDSATKSNFDEQHFRKTPPYSPFTTEKPSIFSKFPHDGCIDKIDYESNRSGMLNTSKG